MKKAPRPIVARRRFATVIFVSLVPLALVASFAGANGAGEGPKAVLKAESFDKDPGWEGFNNHVVPANRPAVTQDFGYSATNFAGKEKGELGGRVTRASKPAYYADRLAAKTLNDRLSAEGTFALTATDGNSGVFFGWFNAEQQDGTGRPVNSLGMEFDGEKSGARLAVRLIGATNKTCGTFVTPFIPGKLRPTPIKKDGTRYAWNLDYDPEANGGNGRFQYSVKSNSPKPEEFEGKTFSVDLPAGFKKLGATFDRFGLLNTTKPGSAMTVYFDDVRHDGKSEDFATDPGWAGSGNRVTYKDPYQVGVHDFGYSAGTNFAGGKPGELGGNLWRGGKYGYYADRVGPLGLEDRLEARGKVVLKVGAPDSDVYLGWFNSADKSKPPSEAGHFLGVHVGGPTRVGHYFHPACTSARATQAVVKDGPVLVPGRVYDWSLVYEPRANGGKGEIRVTLGEETVTLPLKAGFRAEGASFDRFGLFNSVAGGQLVRIFLDDLQYSSARGK